MKKLFETLTILFCVLALAGYGFKIMHLPGAGVMLVTGTVALLALLFYWLIQVKKSLVNIFFFLLVLNFLVAHLFRMMNWAGENILMGLLPIFTVIFLTIFMVKKGS
jgi:hypothetical protein